METVLLMFLYNAAFVFAIRVFEGKGRITRRVIVGLALSQILCDMAAICAVVHFSGGVENFFIILILLPLVIATELLPQSLAYAAAAVAVLLVNAMAWSEQQGLLRHVQVIWPSGQSPGNGYLSRLYVLEVTAAMTVMIFATVFIASSISKRLRQREAELEQAYTRLNLADEAKSFFMRKAGHDMRAPLAAISSILSTVEETAEGLAESHKQLIGRAKPAHTR